ncbi:MAG: serine O-acetyltransferase [Verrucomicrobiales bacterium]
MEKTFSQVTEEILASYEKLGGMNNVDGSNLPSKAAVAELCVDLLQLLFPGFHDQEPIHSKELRRLTQYRVQNIARLLTDEVTKALRLVLPDCPSKQADDIVMSFFGEFPNLRSTIHTDVEAAYEGDPAVTLHDEIILAYPSIETISIQRLAHFFHVACVPLVPRMMTEWAHARTGIDVHPGASIGTHFFIDHGTGVVIGETCVIGNAVKLYHGVTLGARSFKKDAEGRLVKGGKRHPDVEDGVIIYPNSTILGGDTVIGEGCTIGGNVFLQHSVPANTLVIYEEKQLKFINKLDKEKVEALDFSI